MQRWKWFGMQMLSILTLAAEPHRQEKVISCPASYSVFSAYLNKNQTAMKNRLLSCSGRILAFHKTDDLPAEIARFHNVFSSLQRPELLEILISGKGKQEIKAYLLSSRDEMAKIPRIGENLEFTAQIAIKPYRAAKSWILILLNQESVYKVKP